MASQPIYQIYAELADYEPKIWRRFQVLQTASVARLGYIVMTLFEMQASHLFCIKVPFHTNHLQYRKKLGFPDQHLLFLQPVGRYEVQNVWSDASSDSQDAASARLHQALAHEGDRAVMEYDFGDGWEIYLLVEKIICDPELPGRELPRVLAGAGYGILEDCGGTDGLADIARAFQQQSGDLYESYAQWLGTDTLDLASFDLADMNFRLKKVPRIYSDLYEHGRVPSKQSMDILTRAYRNPESCGVSL